MKKYPLKNIIKERDRKNRDADKHKIKSFKKLLVWLEDLQDMRDSGMKETEIAKFFLKNFSVIYHFPL